MKKLPKIYQNPLEKKIKNNKMVFDSLKESNGLEDRIETNEENHERENFDTLTVHEKIQELVNQNSYIFNTKVSLVFSNREEVCQIAGVVNNHIITMDNRIIKISELKDIKILK